ncbi:hypothetical protein M409DRAFT_21634 [Zasmidium cellare ATCC 36951]|uniref:NmrA-like domain-containing protein n=1 Tax=Zasmidium cellare ATCC 36951 TaxID=1080233 RepID=A0A6A6CPX9_ZASCE|nr:uncharacterized protein M409DRAFT_21634 [Zasmidium cellare ATCC 36951]KAF2168190.1 hypothetical protein M409DRAFT_21634 [Zasmidium cellare ATCC 36951]
MVTVALAGATTGFGLTILRTFLHLNKGEHKIVLLSRSPQPALSARGIDVRPVDYTSHAQLVQALQGVHTLLSVIGGSLQGLLDSQLALIDAAKEAGIKRFAPSEYAGNGYEGVDLYQPKAVVWEATQKSGLEYTRFGCGLFMSVLATGTPKGRTEVGEREGVATGEEEALAGLRPWNFVVNVKAGTADFAGDGSAPTVLTEMRDVARFVWEALSLEKWEPDMGMRGDVKSFRELVQILEKVQGRKFLSQDNSFEKLEEEAEDPSKRFYNQARMALEKGWGMVGDDLNRAFPNVKPTTCEEFIEKWWGGVQLGEAKWEEMKSFSEEDF